MFLIILHRNSQVQGMCHGIYYIQIGLHKIVNVIKFYFISIMSHDCILHTDIMK